MCGEAEDRHTVDTPVEGPCPRVRGSLDLHIGELVARGSIPACAGKPPDNAFDNRIARVHPRVCGEALAPDGDADVDPGPSPRVRGSPTSAMASSMISGSIPACAGKPQWQRCRG